MSDWLDDVASLGCIVCLLEKHVVSPCEIHHIKARNKAKSLRNDDEHTIPLCPWHHRLGPFGEAYHAGPREWEKRHGNQSDHLVLVTELIRRKRTWENPFENVG